MNKNRCDKASDEIHRLHQKEQKIGICPCITRGTKCFKRAYFADLSRSGFRDLLASRRRSRQQNSWPHRETIPTIRSKYYRTGIGLESGVRYCGQPSNTRIKPRGCSLYRYFATLVVDGTKYLQIPALVSKQTPLSFSRT